MRDAFVKKISELAARDKNVILVTGDLGFMLFEDFAKKFPNQYINVGVAEQNMIGVSAGLALTGKFVFAYSISTFASMRPFEQIRNDICYHNLPVCIIGAGSAFSYGSAGCTHFPLQDLGIMRTLPNISVLSPGDPIEVDILLGEAYKRKRPAYMRIAKRGEPKIHTSNLPISLGKTSKILSGNDVSVLVSGRQLFNAFEATKILKKKHNINVELISCHTLKPIDDKGILKSIKKCGAILTCEEHSSIGGLKTIVSEILAENRLAVPFKSLNVPDEFPSGAGSQEYFLEKYDLSIEGIVRAILDVVKEK